MTDSELLKDLNRMPVNVMALRLLEESGDHAVDGSLHCVRAAMHAIKSNEVTVETDVAETVAAMMFWRPQRLVNFLMLMNGEEYDPPGWVNAGDLKEFAQAVLDDIENKMVTHFPYYRSPE